MTAHRLHDALFGMDNLPAELKHQLEQNKLSAYLDNVIGQSYHAHTQLLLSAGQEVGYIYFLEKGMVRGYYFDEQKQKEHTVILWDEKAIFTEPSGFFKKLPTELNIEVMAGSQLLFLSHRQLIDIYQTFPYTKIFTACITLQYAAHFSKRSYDLVSLSAWDRYRQLLVKFPGIEQKITKEMIASYIDVAPQSLSRLLKENRNL